MKITVMKTATNLVQLPEGVLVVVRDPSRSFLRLRLGNTIYGPDANNVWHEQADAAQRYTAFVPVAEVITEPVVG